MTPSYKKGEITMLKRTMKYTDYNGNEITEDFYFNLTEAELAELQLSVDGGMAAMMETIVNTNDIPTLITVFKKILLASYGKKSPDGKRFMKNDEIRAAFVESPVYSDLFMELAGDAEKAANFINAIVPQSAKVNLNAVQTQTLNNA